MAVLTDGLQTSDMGITEHVEGDECKFAVWSGRTPASESKVSAII